MAFEFLRDSKVYLQHGSNYYNLHVETDVSFGQTFKQGEYKTRTLHNQKNLFEGSTITTANPASFSFSIPMVDNSSNQHKPIDLLLDYNGDTLNTFTLFFDPETSSKMYKLENCVITSGAFSINRGRVMSVGIDGEGTELSRITGPFSTLGVSLQAYVDSDDLSYAVPRVLDLTVDGNTLENIISIVLEVQNDISWTKNTTLHDSLSVTNSTNTIYPTNFTLEGRTLSGSFSQYVNQTVTQSYNNWFTWKENVPINIRAGLASNNYQLQALLPGSSFTNRPNTGDVLTQSYDFRLMTSPSDLKSYFTY